MVYEIKETIEKLHEGCAQYACWNIDEFDTDTGFGFVVQDIKIVRMKDEETVSEHRYFEAWDVENRKIVQDSAITSTYDDIYSMGNFNFHFRDVLPLSIGHSGEVAFYPKVYWVEKDTPLYDTVMKWKPVVKEACGLKSVDFTPEWGKVFSGLKPYKREPFIHKWDFIEVDKIYEGIMDYYILALRGSPCEDRNFESLINEIKEEIDKVVNDTGRTEYNEILGRVKNARNNRGCETQ